MMDHPSNEHHHGNVSELDQTHPKYDSNVAETNDKKVAIFIMIVSSGFSII